MYPFICFPKFKNIVSIKIHDSRAKFASHPWKGNSDSAHDTWQTVSRFRTLGTLAMILLLPSKLNTWSKHLVRGQETADTGNFVWIHAC